MLAAIAMSYQMSLLDWMVVCIPLVAIVIIGCKVQGYVKSVSGFLAAGRKAGRYLLTVADGTAGMGLISVSAVFEMQYRTGFALGFWNNLVSALALVMTLTGFVTYRYRETRVLTMAELFEKRYSHNFRIFAGSLAFISGLINSALFPAVGARFIMYYCNLPFILRIGGLHFSTYGVLMAIFLGVALFIVLTGGQLTTMVTDCCQGIFGYFAYTVITVLLLCSFSFVDIQEAMLSRPEGMSFFNPFNVSKFTSFNLLYIFIGMFSMVYNRNCWLGAQAYLSSASSPHEQKMAGVLGTWRAGFQNIALTLLVICAYTYMHANGYKAQREVVEQELTTMVSQEFPYTPEMTQYLKEQPNGIISPDDTSPIAVSINGKDRQRDAIRSQVLVPMALRHIFPIGITGIFCAVMIFLMVSTDTTYLHSWGTILAQDIILPTYNKSVKTKTQINLLRYSIIFVAVFAWFFSYYFSQGDFILQFFALTGTIYLGGSGAVVLGALYWKKGTTAGAYTSMTLGLFFAILGFLLDQKWATLIYPFLHTHAPVLLEGFRTGLSKLGEYLIFVNWEASPEMFMKKFPITSQEFYFISMLTALLGYVIVSLLTCKESFNLDKLLHRGEYNLEHFVADDAKSQEEARKEKEEEAKGKKRFDWKGKLLGFTPEYTRGDRILAISVLAWSGYNFLFFLVEAVWNLVPSWRWSELTWFKLWQYYSVPVSLILAIVTTIWFTCGGVRDLRRLFKGLREDMLNAKNNQENSDNGMVRKDE